MYLSAASSLKLGCSSTNLRVRNSATSQEARGDSSSGAEPSERPPRLTPRVKPKEKWMKGDGPGEYGGPPIDLKIRPSWGGGAKEDPLTSTGDYIWKKTWQPFVETPPSETKPPPPLVCAYSHLFII